MLDNRTMMTTKDGKTIRQIEKFILELNYKFFYKSCITERYFRRYRILVDNVLNDLVHRRLLHEGVDETSFLNIKRSSSIKTYLKFIPTVEDKQRFSDDLLRNFDIEYEHYVTIFKQSPLVPPNCDLTTYGRNFMNQSQYHVLMTERKIYPTMFKELL